MSHIRILRFFSMVLRPTPTILLAAGLLIMFAVYIARVDPAGLDQTAGIGLLIQMFAASTGYRDRATRGHFDPVLVAGSSRLAVAVAHWGCSVAPGLALWTVVGLLDSVTGAIHWPSAWSLSACVAMLWASNAAWALTLPYPRYAGGVFWLVSIVVLASGQRLQLLREVFLAGGSTWAQAVRSAGASLVCPLFLVAQPAAASPQMLALVTLAAVTAWTFGVRFIRMMDVPLVEPR